MSFTVITGARKQVPRHATVSSQKVAIHLAGDSNDGRSETYVDSVLRAEVDHYTLGPAHYAQVLVSNLTSGTHTIEVRARFSGDWQIRKSTHDYEKAGAFTAVFTVPVPAGKEVTVEYTARLKQ